MVVAKGCVAMCTKARQSRRQKYYRARRQCPVELHHIVRRISTKTKPRGKREKEFISQMGCGMSSTLNQSWRV